MSTRTRIKRKHTTGRPSTESLATGEMCLVVPENVVYVKKDFENLLAITIGGTQCIIVSSYGTPQENGVALQAAYNEAKTRTPNGAPLSATNRVTLVLTAGKYTPPTTFTVDTQFIDIVSLTGNRDVILTNGIAVRANDVYLKGIDVLTNAFDIGSDSSYPLLKCENCKGGNQSFGGDAYESGLVIEYDENGEWMNESTNIYNVVVSGTFINCVGGSNSFGGTNNGYYYSNLTVSGTFINCKATSGFGLGNPSNNGDLMSIVSGLFIDCKTTGIFSSGGYLQLTGTFIGCKGNATSFGGLETSISGNFTNCEGGFATTFGGISGIFNNCKGVFFIEISNLSGTFNNCIGSFISYNSGISGIFNNCTGVENSFGGQLTEIGGTFNNCIGGLGSFDGTDAFLSGKLYYCRKTIGTFPVVTNGGRTIYCIDGNNNTNNQ